MKTEELIDELCNREDAPLIWISRKVYDLYNENEKLKADYSQANDIIEKQKKQIEKLQKRFDRAIEALRKENRKIEKLEEKYEEEKQEREYYQAIVEHWE